MYWPRRDGFAVAVCVCRSSSENRGGVETRQMMAKRGLFQRLHERLRVATHDAQSKRKIVNKHAPAKVRHRSTLFGLIWCSSNVAGDIDNIKLRRPLLV